MYLPEEARYNYLLELPESEDIGQKVNEAMEAIEKENPELDDILPDKYDRQLYSQTCNEVFDHVWQRF